MARFSKMQVLDAMISTGMVPVYYNKDIETAKQVLEGIKLIQFAESLGGTESLLTYPVTQTHPDLKPEDAERKGITRRLLRLSVGIEDTDDLIADLEQAFNK